MCEKRTKKKKEHGRARAGCRTWRSPSSIPSSFLSGQTLSLSWVHGDSWRNVRLGATATSALRSARLCTAGSSCAEACMLAIAHRPPRVCSACCLESRPLLVAIDIDAALIRTVFAGLCSWARPRRHATNARRWPRRPAIVSASARHHASALDSHAYLAPITNHEG